MYVWISLKVFYTHGKKAVFDSELVIEDHLSLNHFKKVNILQLIKKNRHDA